MKGEKELLVITPKSLTPLTICVYYHQEFPCERIAGEEKPVQ